MSQSIVFVCSVATVIVIVSARHYFHMPLLSLLIHKLRRVLAWLTPGTIVCAREKFNNLNRPVLLSKCVVRILVVAALLYVQTRCICDTSQPPPLLDFAI